MATQVLRDERLRIIGYVEIRPDGVHVGKNARLLVVGYYDPRSDQTKDNRLRIVGHGNLLSGLIHSPCR